MNKLVQQKLCRFCGQPFARRDRYSEIQWSKTIYCSRACCQAEQALLAKAKAKSNYVVTQNSCWGWNGAINSDGYGITERRYKAHRWFFELHRGPIPAGKHLHHVCENKRCVNPDHLMIVSRPEHVRLTLNNPTTKNRAKTHCIRGHEFSGTNLVLRLKPNGKLIRQCSTCTREKHRIRLQTYRHRKWKRSASKNVSFICSAAGFLVATDT